MTRFIVAVVMLTACAGAPRGSRAVTPLTSVDTVYYEVAGSTPAQWRRQLPRAALWKRAHLSEEVGQRLADSIRVEVRRERAQECAPLIEQTRRKVEEFGVRYTAAMHAAEAALGEESRPALP